MHTNIRRSSTKARKMKGFRTRMKTKSGRQIINRQRRRSTGKGKFNRKTVWHRNAGKRC
ncbi:MAG: 50S ribosomal protein L34 [Proteobacteria bacterium]|jgi:ribosomal protein L34|nr:50S ribosomal protein L34 [Pseudomonadota bacterium]